MEIWMGLFMQPIHGVEGGLLTNEFAQRRGAIIFHSILYVLRDYLNVINVYDKDNGNSEATLSHIKYEDDMHISATSRIDLLMINNSISLFNLFAKIDEFIDMFYSRSELFPVNTTTLGRKDDGMVKREKIYNVIPGGEDIWVVFIK